MPTGAFETDGVEATWALAARVAASLKSGDVVCLEGDLGAGKTTFVQGLAAALGAGGRVASPTFCIVREHRCADGLLFVHMDLYRLGDEDDVLAIGWEDYLERGAIIAVEWPERAGSLVPPGAVHISFKHLDGESRRLITI
ncbi:MAG: tRNA (adenosine(37)-N6)-threonylcarbamoyltransferase complex ATPase subunit type 1 TsaE [Kiritimatiellae bacterium]|nr:tRNA (adenosine(37)-N6)-threonylcarbamoyltransferase complex ATPase subunit type 1 TsaE [Kiritimatiellia bacterium]